MKKYTEFHKINEGLTSIIYHFTSIYYLTKISNDNMLQMSGIIGNQSDKSSTGEMYYASFSRTKSIKHGFGSKFNKSGSVRIKLDGDKLANNYKGIQFDYWRSSRKAKDMRMSPSLDEMEDRILSNKNSIVDLNKDIIKIDILKDEDRHIPVSIINYGKEFGIDIYFFSNVEDFSYGLESKSYKVEESEINYNNNKDKYDIFNPSIPYLIALYLYKKSDEEREKVFSEVRKNLKKSDISDIIEKVDDEILNLKHTLYDDFRLNSIVSNYKHHLSKKDSDKTYRYVYHLISNEYYKNKSTNLKDYFLSKVYDKRQGVYNIEIVGKTKVKINEILNKGLDYYKSDTFEENGIWVELGNCENYIKYIKLISDNIKKYISNLILNDKDNYIYNILKVDYKSIKENISIDRNIEKMSNKLEDSGMDYQTYISVSTSWIYMSIHDISSYISKELHEAQEDLKGLNR